MLQRKTTWPELHNYNKLPLVWDHPRKLWSVKPPNISLTTSFLDTILSTQQGYQVVEDLD